MLSIIHTNRTSIFSFLLSASGLALCQSDTSTVTTEIQEAISIVDFLISSSCLFDIYTLILNSLLHANAYPGKSSHISMQLFSTDTGLVLKLSGFNQHLSTYLETLIKIVHEFQIDETALVAWKHELKDEYHRLLQDSKSLIKLSNYFTFHTI